MLRVTQLITPENTITYHNALCLSPQNFAEDSHPNASEDEPLTVAKVYLACLETPYYKFLRDTLSYIIMLFLHYALCLSPSTIEFSGLEWTIFVFYVGRVVAELKQIYCIKECLRHKKNETLLRRCFRIFSVYCR